MNDGTSTKGMAAVEAFQHAGARTPSTYRWAATLLPSVYAAVLGIVELISHRSDPLEPDARAFLAWAASFSPSSLVGGSREPLWIAIMAFPVSLMGPSSDVPRLLGIAGFVLMIASFQLLVWKLYGRGWALLAAMLLASSPWLTFQAVQGLREETSAAFLLLFGIGVVFAGKDPRRIAGLAFLVGLTAMLRWDTLLITLPVSVTALAVRRVQIRYWIMPVVIVAVVVSPLVVGNWVKYGDPMYQSNIHARFFRNVEFQGKPGFLTPQQVAANSFGGPPITWAGYLLGLHTPAQLAERTVVGVIGIPYGEVFRTIFHPDRVLRPEQLGKFDMQFVKAMVAGLLALVGLAGGAFLLLSRAWPLGLMLFLCTAEFSPIAQIFDPRLALATVPLLLLGWLEVIAFLMGRRPSAPMAQKLQYLAIFSSSTLWRRLAGNEERGKR